jgi:hypothetical protein
MPSFSLIAQGLSAFIFIWYGAGCFLSRRMVAEFERYCMPTLRRLTGTLQMAGGVAIVAGHFYRPLLLLGAGGLAAMMLVAFVTRVRIRDPFYEAIPSFSLLLLNAYLVGAALRG